MDAELRAAIEAWQTAHKVLDETSETWRDEPNIDSLNRAIEVYTSAKERLLIVALWMTLDERD